ncbi:hypothetical protein BD410DRAFT_558097 [Rickenella mellea]|uniref:Uncharacterized protein n=1 Tax=Rickenella mellea TaxID=50990 RepID=A0A4Y7QE36_9AGAM|nr:hypothetical protein BD410DRAFT_558097 [Rickenella mellea]
MSTKQGRKRKTRLTPRERTVLTFTEDPSSHFLVPTSTEEVAGDLMASSFPVGSSSSTNTGSVNFPTHGGSFPGFTYTNFPPSINGQPSINSQNQVQQSGIQRAQEGHISTGNSDLDRLERLKKEILDGQNSFYKAVPQPAFLESIYLGREAHGQAAVPAHPDQLSSNAKLSNSSQQHSSRQGKEVSSMREDDGGRQSQAQREKVPFSRERMPPKTLLSHGVIVRTLSLRRTEVPYAAALKQHPKPLRQRPL